MTDWIEIKSAGVSPIAVGAHSVFGRVLVKQGEGADRLVSGDRIVASHSVGPGTRVTEWTRVAGGGGSSAGPQAVEQWAAERYLEWLVQQQAPWTHPPRGLVLRSWGAPPEALVRMLAHFDGARSRLASALPSPPAPHHLASTAEDRVFDDLQRVTERALASWRYVYLSADVEIQPVLDRIRRLAGRARPADFALDPEPSVEASILALMKVLEDRPLAISRLEAAEAKHLSLVSLNPFGGSRGASSRGERRVAWQTEPVPERVAGLLAALQDREGLLPAGLAGLYQYAGGLQLGLFELDSQTPISAGDPWLILPLSEVRLRADFHDRPFIRFGAFGCFETAFCARTGEVWRVPASPGGGVHSSGRTPFGAPAWSTEPVRLARDISSYLRALAERGGYPFVDDFSAPRSEAVASELHEALPAARFVSIPPTLDLTSGGELDEVGSAFLSAAPESADLRALRELNLEGNVERLHLLSSADEDGLSLVDFYRFSRWSDCPRPNDPCVFPFGGADGDHLGLFFYPPALEAGLRPPVVFYFHEEAPMLSWVAESAQHLRQMLKSSERVAPDSPLRGGRHELITRALSGFGETPDLMEERDLVGDVFAEEPGAFKRLESFYLAHGWTFALAHLRQGSLG